MSSHVALRLQDDLYRRAAKLMRSGASLHAIARALDVKAGSVPKMVDRGQKLLELDAKGKPA